MGYRKKLIEVALPLDAINRESAREKSIRHGHPSTLHVWWARRPLAACRAVLFAQLVDDPSEHPELFPTPEAQQAERQRLFRLIEELVRWENSGNDQVLRQAREEIRKSTGGSPPPVLDPFCGGGSIPLEAQRLGLEAHASDLNPVAVLITKALVEIPPKFAGRPPIHPGQEQQTMDAVWTGAKGLAEDIRYYGRWMRDEAERRVGHLYPKVKLPKEQGGGEATVIAWLWARTVASPNPACGGTHVPLVRSFALSTKRAKRVWVEPVVDKAGLTYSFKVTGGTGEAPRGTISKTGAICLFSGAPIPLQYIRAEAKAGRMGARLMAMVAEGKSGRTYLPPDEAHGIVGGSAQPSWRPEERVTTPSHDVDRLPMYGMSTWGEAFTARQLVALTTFVDLLSDCRSLVVKQSDEASDFHAASERLAYADALITYLALAVSRLANRSSTICFWDTTGEKIQQVFARQAIPMTWDFAEGNPFSNSSGNFLGQVEYLARVVEAWPGGPQASVEQADARALAPETRPVVCTDPPYYDNIGYADLSDFFYVWLRRALRDVYPDLFVTLLTPKSEELIASPYRFGGDRLAAKTFFESGLRETFTRIAHYQNPAYPLTLFYAFKQSESETNGEDKTRATASTGWETMLEGLLRAGFIVTGTWPMRTELVGNLKRNVSALASSIVIACRPRPAQAAPSTRHDFLKALKSELPLALKNLQQGNIAPVDLAQAAIGPGMAIFSRYTKVLEADGSPMRVRMALALINQVLDEYFAACEGDYDPDTRWALAWFEQFGFREGAFGEAETLSKAKNTAVDALVSAGILAARGGKVRLLRRSELAPDWEPGTDRRVTVWEVTHHLIRRLLDEGGERGAAVLLRKVGSLGESARELAYHLYTICDRKGWAQDALAYNSLVVAWPEVARLAAEGEGRPSVQEALFGGDRS